MRRRLEDFLPNFEASVNELDAIVGALEVYPPVEERISRDVEARRIELDTEMRCELEPVVRRELEARNSATVAELQRVLQDVAEAEAKRSELQHQVKMLTRSATDLKAALASDLGIVHDALEPPRWMHLTA